VNEDEEQRSTAVAVRDGDMGDGAEESGDAAPAIAETEARPDGSTTAAPADPVGSDTVIDDAVSEDAVADDAIGEAPADETGDGGADGSAAVGVGEMTGEPELVDAAAVAVGADPAASGLPWPGPYLRPRSHLRRGVVAVIVVGLVALAVTAVARIVPSLDAANSRFVEAVQSRGHVIAPGEQEALVLSAARKICARKLSHNTLEERRSTALSSAELAAVDAVFGAETRDFTALALDTYCTE
jgi:hypothetical protein